MSKMLSIYFGCVWGAVQVYFLLIHVSLELRRAVLNPSREDSQLS